MPELVEAIPAWAAAGGSAGAGYFLIKFIIEQIIGRLDKREAAVAASSEQLDERTYKLIDKLEERLNALTARLDQVEHELTECRAQHAVCEAELAKLRAIVQGFGDAKQQAANIVAAERLQDRGVAKIVGKIGGPE